MVNILRLRLCKRTCTYVRDSFVLWRERAPVRTIVSTTVCTCQYCNDADADVEADSIPLLYINNAFQIQISYESMQNSAGQWLDRSEQKKTCRWIESQNMKILISLALHWFQYSNYCNSMIATLPGISVLDKISVHTPFFVNFFFFVGFDFRFLVYFHICCTNIFFVSRVFLSSNLRYLYSFIFLFFSMIIFLGIIPVILMFFT